MTLKQCIMTNSTCYKGTSKSAKTGIVVHSTGCNNTYIKRYVQPLKTDANYNEVIADIGKNTYGNDWNHKKRSGGVHAFIGKNKAGAIETYQVMPYEKDAWGVGRGKWIYANSPYYSDKSFKKKVGTTTKAFMGSTNDSKKCCIGFVENGKTYYVPYKYCGSYNFAPNSRIQFEICEDNLKNEAYFNAVMKEAQEYCAYLCKEFGWGVDKISSHGESIKEGFGQAHEDPLPWMKKFKKDMNWFRAEVQKILDKDKPEPQPTPPTPVFTPYKVKITGSVYYRTGPGTNNKIVGVLKKGTTHTVINEADGKGATKWGELSTKKGWFSLDFAKKIK